MRAGACHILASTAALIVLATSGGAAMAENAAKKENELRRLASAYGDCVVKHHASEARAVILENAGNATIKQSVSGLIDEGCMGQAKGIEDESPSGLWFRAEAFRSGLADALVRKDYPDVRHFDFASVPPLTHWQVRPLDPALAAAKTRKARRAVQQHENALAVVAVHYFGECVVRVSPDKVHALLLSTPGTPAETQIFGDLSENLGACLKQGQVRFGRTVLRGALAVNFYRLAGPPPGAQVAKIEVSN